jgi:hypothetical protein
MEILEYTCDDTFKYVQRPYPNQGRNNFSHDFWSS